MPVPAAAQSPAAPQEPAVLLRHAGAQLAWRGLRCGGLPLLRPLARRRPAQQVPPQQLWPCQQLLTAVLSPAPARRAVLACRPPLHIALQ